MPLWLLGRGECDSVTAWRPLLGPAQRLEQPAVYANTDQQLAGTILEKKKQSEGPRIQVISDCCSWEYNCQSAGLTQQAHRAPIKIL